MPLLCSSLLLFTTNLRPYHLRVQKRSHKWEYPSYLEMRQASKCLSMTWLRYYHLVRLMGRSASHIALEVAIAPVSTAMMLPCRSMLPCCCFTHVVSWRNMYHFLVTLQQHGCADISPATCLVTTNRRFWHVLMHAYLAKRCDLKQHQTTIERLLDIIV